MFYKNVSFIIEAKNYHKNLFYTKVWEGNDFVMIVKERAKVVLSCV